MRASVRLEGPVVNRPIEDVFGFNSDFANSPQWGRTSKSVKDPDGKRVRFSDGAHFVWNGAYRLADAVLPVTETDWGIDLGH